jgi:UTP--glucose-1-phosphate uridylyltransferase
MKAFVEYGIQHDTLGDDFTQWMKELSSTLNKTK